MKIIPASIAGGVAMSTSAAYALAGTHRVVTGSHRWVNARVALMGMRPHLR